MHMLYECLNYLKLYSNTFHVLDFFFLTFQYTFFFERWLYLI